MLELFEETDILCPHCGAADTGQYCSSCGNSLLVTKENFEKLFTFHLISDGYTKNFNDQSFILNIKSLGLCNIQVYERARTLHGTCQFDTIIISLEFSEYSRLVSLEKKHLSRRVVDATSKMGLSPLSVTVVYLDRGDNTASRAIKLRPRILPALKCNFISVNMNNLGFIPKSLVGTIVESSLMQVIGSPKSERKSNIRSILEIPHEVIRRYIASVFLATQPERVIRALQNGKITNKTISESLFLSFAFTSVVTNWVGVNFLQLTSYPILDDLISITIFAFYILPFAISVHLILTPFFSVTTKQLKLSILITLFIGVVLYPYVVALNIFMKTDFFLGITGLNNSSPKAWGLLIAYMGFAMAQIYKISIWQIFVPIILSSILTILPITFIILSWL